LSKNFAWQFRNRVGADLLNYVEKFFYKNFKGIEDDIQHSQSLEKLTYF